MRPDAQPRPWPPAETCGDCGMPCDPGEYHPYAACLMFKACHNSDTVRGNLQAVLDHGRLVRDGGE